MPLNNPAAAKSVASGTFTADNADGRQITTGFKCSLVIILRPAQVWAVLILPDQNFRISTGGGANVVSGSSIHATDGFVVNGTVEPLTNVGSETYYYWAISD